MEYTLDDLERWNCDIEEVVNSIGLKCYPQEFEIISYKDMLAYEAYTGMPSHYPHWSFGKSYEKNKLLYRYNLVGLPYEMVINSDPCLAYLMKDNSLLLQILTMSHVYGHNDFFKNNRLFKEGTTANYTFEMFKTGADNLRKYINDPSIGYTRVERILDAAHAIRYQTKGRFTRFSTFENNINSQRHKNQTNNATNDILTFIAYNADLEEWERNVLEIVKQETYYFIPQIETKIMNEGWACYWHYYILNKLGLDSGLQLEFIKRHNDVISPHVGGINPYYLGFKMFEDIEKRFGIDKLFEIREIERDESFLRRYLTEELCLNLNLFQYAKKGNDYFVQEISDDSGWRNIRETLCNSCGMGFIPTIQIEGISKQNHVMLLRHVFDDRELNTEYMEATLKYIVELWNHGVVLNTKLNGKEIKVSCDENKHMSVL